MLPQRFVAPCLLTALVAGAVVTDLPAAAQEPEAQTAEQEPSEIPAGHPQMTTPKPHAFEMPEVPEGSGTGETGLSWTTPEGWVEEEPTNAMRKAQYRIPGEAGDSELVVYYFGPGQGGDPMANCERWAGQFVQPNGAPRSRRCRRPR